MGSEMARKPEPAPTTPDPIEIAMEAEASGVAPAGIAHEFLANQNRLVSWQIASERAGFALKVLTGLAGLAVVAGLSWAMWDASRASGAVIEPFDSAPALEAQGLTGEAIAREVVSRVTTMQNGAGSIRPSRQSSSSGDGIDVVIPQTGVSVAEIQRLLRSWLGHETHVSGALRPSTDGGLDLSLRVDGRRVAVAPPPPEQRGSSEAWIDSAAAAAMRETDPYRFGVWLYNQGRLDEAEVAYSRIATAGSAQERAWGWHGLGQVRRVRRDFQGAALAAEMAMRMDPHMDSAAETLCFILSLSTNSGQGSTPAALNRCLCLLRKSCSSFSSSP